MSDRLDERIVMAIDLDYFYAQCEQVRNKEIRDKPVVICVFSGRSEDSGAVSTANYIARKLGVKSGIPIVTAKRILKGHADSVFLPMDKQYYELVSTRIMDMLRSGCDGFEQVSIDEAYLDITSKSAGRYSSAESMAREAKQRILGSEGLTCSVGVSKNKLISKMAADQCKPDGLLLVEPRNIENFLGTMPVGKLPGIGPKLEEKLNSLGIKKIGDLAAFDEEKLSSIFGRNLGPHLKEVANGIDSDPVSGREATQLSRIITLKHNSSSFDFKDDLRPLARDIAERLRESKNGFKSISAIAITSELKVKTKAHTLEEPSDAEERIFSEACKLFEAFFAEPLRIELRRVGIRVSTFEKKWEPEGSGVLTDYF
ncbi:MAG: Y-family DNA polymerase [Nitrososphaerales archaeon]